MRQTLGLVKGMLFMMIEEETDMASLVIGRRKNSGSQECKLGKSCGPLGVGVLEGGGHAAPGGALLCGG